MMLNKRVFFGFEVKGPFESNFPEGRVLLEEDYHVTAAFLGSIDFNSFNKILDNLPLPPWNIGLVAESVRPLFLPPFKPRVAAWEWELRELALPFLSYQKTLTSYLQKEKLLNEKEIKRSFLLHTTLSRAPFREREWRDYFKKIPLVIGNFHLYESLGASRYQKVWTYPIFSPFEEIQHTADIAFKIRGNSLSMIALHAYFALAHKCPSLLNYPFLIEDIKNLSELIASLNALIALLDIQEGSPMKAVSYHGDIKNKENAFLEWEMIIDV